MEERIVLVEGVAVRWGGGMVGSGGSDSRSYLKTNGEEEENDDDDDD